MKTCPHCLNTGHRGELYCTCRSGGRAFRKALDTAPEFAEYRRVAAETDHMMRLIERGDLRLADVGAYWHAATHPAEGQA